MSGASGKVPSAIHVAPEALDGGLIGKLQNGDIIRVDATNGTLSVLTDGVELRTASMPDLSANHAGCGREMFDLFRQAVGSAPTGAAAIL